MAQTTGHTCIFSDTNINWSAFILAGATTLLIALLTTGYQAVKAAQANLVRALRHD